MEWEVKTEPSVEPVTLQELKDSIRLDSDLDDKELNSLLTSAREQIELDTGRSFVTQTRVMRLSCFPSASETRINLIGTPVSSITHVKYYDSDGVQQTWSSSNYSLRQGEPAWVQLAYEKDWPEHRSKQDEIEIEYVCGGAVSTVAERVKDAIKLKVKAEFAETDSKEHERIMMSYDAIVQGLRIGEEFLTYG